MSGQRSTNFTGVLMGRFHDHRRKQAHDMLRHATRRSRLALFWPTFFSTMRWMPGWHGHTRISHGVGMQMMDWCTAVASGKQKPSRRTFRLVWRKPSGDASDENQYRLLQGRQPQRPIPERQI
jgi:hypothetical protein